MWPMFEGVPDEARRALEAATEERRYAREETVFDQGDPADALYAVTTGRFAVEFARDGAESVLLTILGPGDVFGEVALCEEGARRSARVVAVEPATTWSISKSSFDALRAADPRVDRFLIGILTAQVRRLTEQNFDATRLGPEQRIRRRLCALARTYGGDGSEPLEIPLPAEAIAQLTGTDRASVRAVIDAETAAGTLTTDRGRVLVTDLAALERNAVS
jgi:CRP-like cAMP-binding protein